MKLRKTERLTDADLAYHRHVLDVLRDAEAVRIAWLSAAAQTYGLKDGDRIQQDGVIVRGSSG